MFSEYVSLGAEFGGCETGFQLRRHLGFDNAHFFSWRSMPAETILSLLRHRFRGIHEGRSMDEHGHMVDQRYGFHYHGLDTLESDRDKGMHLVRKFYVDRGPRCYLLRLYRDMAEASVRDMAQLLCAISAGSTLLIIRRDGETQGFDIPNVEERQLRFFAPLQDTEAADTPGWDSIFHEFPIDAQPPAFRIAS